MGLPAEDLDHILIHTAGLWEKLRRKRIFITGGTGFFGRWLVESFEWANAKLELGASALVLTRQKLASNPCVQFHQGDMRDFNFPVGEFFAIIHAAAEKDLESNMQGTKRVLEFSQYCRAERLLFTSSGAVYGIQPHDLSYIPESYTGTPVTAYGRSKHMAELLWAECGDRHGLIATIARCFAFVGPYLPLDAHYAIGNFIRDALTGGPIRVQSDGTPCRSYLYAADLAIWLWTILLKGHPSRAYNVGSDFSLTIGDLARFIARGMEVRIAMKSPPNASVERYIPSIERAQKELGLEVKITLHEAIRRMWEWHSEGRR